MNKQCSIVFNKTCLNDNLLPRYTLFKIYMCVCVCVCVYKCMYMCIYSITKYKYTTISFFCNNMHNLKPKWPAFPFMGGLILKQNNIPFN